jgi:hypothetical protein
MKWLGIVGVLIVGMVVWYGVSYPSVTVRYRLTLEALVDGELKTASGVREVTYSKGLAVGGQGALSIAVRGEAIALDLGDRGTLFALVSAGLDGRSGPEWIVLRAFDFDGMPSPVEEGIKQVLRLSGKRELPPDRLPKLVRFRDPSDLRSVEWVNPLNIGDRFGADAKLVRVTLEIVPTGIWPLNDYGITGEPLTSGIESKLAWWSRPWLEPMGDGVFVDTKVNKTDFKRG